MSHFEPIARPSIPVMVGGKSSNQAMLVNSHIGGQPLVRVTLPISGTMSSSGQVALIAQPTMVMPPTNTYLVPPQSSTIQPLGSQPVNNTAS